MGDHFDIKRILSKNIKNCREKLHITQAKLAEFANISTSHVVDIELCRTWVSDKTLTNIARVLNMEVYELFIPEIAQKTYNQDKKRNRQYQIAELINKKKSLLRHDMDETFNNLIVEIMQFYEEK